MTGRRHQNRPPVSYAAIRRNVMTELQLSGPMMSFDLCRRMLDLHRHSEVATRQALRSLQGDGYVKQEKPGTPWALVDQA